MSQRRPAIRNYQPQYVKDEKGWLDCCSSNAVDYNTLNFSRKPITMNGRTIG